MGSHAIFVPLLLLWPETAPSVSGWFAVGGDVTTPSFARPAHERVLALSREVEGCWVFGGATTRGYGRIKVGSQTDASRRMAQAHRVMYEALVGPIPVGLEIDHLCRNRSCVNPAHLEAVTNSENKRRSPHHMRGGARRFQTHCKRGHEFTVANTYVRPGGRECIPCRTMFRHAPRTQLAVT